METDTRSRILDAAAQIMHRDGIAKTTTRQIAKAAKCSEALLYKYFSDKQEIFLRVLVERMPRIASTAELAGHSTVLANLTMLTDQLLAFYVRSFPMAASIFSDAKLLLAHRDGMGARGAGPTGPQRIVRGYLDAEQQLGRLDPTVDCDALARLLTGAALHEAFLASFAGQTEIPDRADLAQRLARTVMSGTGVATT